ncbi:MAG: two-component system phosphate regulon sensor histidine kinase PhoR [Cyclobacteriaceae bacterium]|jgi:two-component system phosphate regulon sensor histidine kinase PhoR
MTMGLVGLIGFQLYWIEAVVGANEEGFKRDVMDALQSVSEKLEKQEALFAFHNQFQFSASGLFNSPGSVDPFGPPSSPNNAGIEIKTDTIYSDNGFSIVLDIQSTNQTIEFNADAQQQQWIDQQLAKVNRKSEMIFQVLENMLIPNRSISTRFRPEQLDSLLKSELSSRGIDIKFEYGVISPMQNRFVHLTNYDAKQNLEQTELKTSLFPNDLMGDQNWLVIDFPDKEGFLLRKIWLTMASSGFLILIIASTFGFAIVTIMRQKKLSEIKNDFINNMTHELKTPIATISLAAEALNDKDILQAPDMRDRYLKVIAEENSRLGEQVERVLNMAALEKSDFNLKQEEINLHQLIDIAIDKTMIQIEKRGGSLKAIFEANQPQVLVDKTHMTNIILNLLDNANKYSPDAPHITIRTRNTSQSIMFSVQDHGIGMSREAQKHIFQKFYRVPTGNIHNVKGFGLGLAYVKTMTDAQNGTIAVDSEPGRGSKFTITLPLYHG